MGYSEVTLLGQTVNSYVYEDVDFADLLRSVAQIKGLERIRYTSPYPIDFSDKLIRTLAELDNVRTTCTCLCRAAQTRCSTA